MTWFKVDDSFHSHPKVLATDPAALGLWVIAGSWSSAHLTEGFVPDEVLPRLLPDAETLARKLVTAGLWMRRKGGHQFHDWLEKNPSKEAVVRRRSKGAARQQRWRAAQRRGVGDADSNGVTNAAPDPTRPEGRGAGGARPDARASPGGAAEPHHAFDPDANGTCRHCDLPESNRRHREVS